jgi:hypothetical protein
MTAQTLFDIDQSALRSDRPAHHSTKVAGVPSFAAPGLILIENMWSYEENDLIALLRACFVAKELPENRDISEEG